MKTVSNAFYGLKIRKVQCNYVLPVVLLATLSCSPCMKSQEQINAAADEAGIRVLVHPYYPTAASAIVGAGRSDTIEDLEPYLKACVQLGIYSIQLEVANDEKRYHIPIYVAMGTHLSYYVGSELHTASNSTVPYVRVVPARDGKLEVIAQDRIDYGMRLQWETKELGTIDNKMSLHDALQRITKSDEIVAVEIQGGVKMEVQQLTEFLRQIDGVSGGGVTKGRVFWYWRRAKDSANE